MDERTSRSTVDEAIFTSKRTPLGARLDTVTTQRFVRKDFEAISHCNAKNHLGYKNRAYPSAAKPVKKGGRVVALRLEAIEKVPRTSKFGFSLLGRDPVMGRAQASDNIITPGGALLNSDLIRGGRLPRV
ncbi:hypothetical protein IYX23_04095 [Methylocystis sp. L43]|uniref:hypothetical protein n=1 Tax=unclassified Methylocystis TaxID=2625913 RepID=UPI0018C3463C|nr:MULTISPECIES: hypothetical protein [unclassified Methylocystis]MBG0796875.1 hypothetical protein [Methylocystis sp. L43]MBG0806162.1 hypothetical protein [Methylocystis sp. H15]